MKNRQISNDQYEICRKALWKKATIYKKHYFTETLPVSLVNDILVVIYSADAFGT